MATSRPRLNRLVAIVVGCGLGAVSLASQSAPAPAYPNAPTGFDARQSGVQSGRLERVEYDSKVTGNKRPAIVYAARLLCGAQVSGAVPAAWHRRQRKSLDAVRRRGRDPRQMNIFPILEGRAPVVERTLFWRTAAGNHNQKAVRRGDYKLLIDANHEFVFDVRRDLGERTDLAAQRQELARTLQQQLAAWEADVDAEARANGTTSFNGGRGGRAGGRGGPGRGQ